MKKQVVGLVASLSATALLLTGCGQKNVAASVPSQAKSDGVNVSKIANGIFEVTKSDDFSVATCYCKTPGLNRVVYIDPNTCVNGVITHTTCLFEGTAGIEDCTGSPEHRAIRSQTKKMCETVCSRQ